uniref:Calcitonin receptor n=1 Tax=Eptatretus burgeri TaxID=7764 RepID=A0A8C4QCX9_EPTBU
MPLFKEDLFVIHSVVLIKTPNPVQGGQTSNMKILLAQYDCYMNIMQMSSHSDTFCKRTWDGWMCWGDTEAGVIASQNCPDYFVDFDTAEKVTKICHKDGHWFRHPESNRTWSNYTFCNNFTAQRKQMTLNMYYLAIAGNSISIVSLTLSLIIFFYFKVDCIDKNRVNWGDLENHSYDKDDERQFTCKTFNQVCWFRSHIVNLFFVLNIVRILVTKLKDTHHAESHMYMKAVRATLILMPLLGIQFVLVPWRPEDRDAGDIYMSIMNIFTHYQVHHVRAVQTVLKRHWLQSQHRTRASKDSFRSPSCNATSISDVPSLGMHHCNGGHINGNAYEEVPFHE